MISMARAISFGLVDGRPVFMDEFDDSYFMLEPAFETEFMKQLTDEVEARSVPELRDALGTDGDPRSVVFARCELPRHSLLAETNARERPRFNDALSLARILHRTSQSLARRPIATILADLAGADDGCAEQLQLEQLVGRARRFLAARPLVPFSANCLLDSLALLRWLGSVGRGALLVFGVKLDPFAAHCWIQSGELLLNDLVENIERFRPVRVVKCTPATR